MHLNLQSIWTKVSGGKAYTKLAELYARASLTVSALAMQWYGHAAPGNQALETESQPSIFDTSVAAHSDPFEGGIQKVTQGQLRIFDQDMRRSQGLKQLSKSVLNAAMKVSGCSDAVFLRERGGRWQDVGFNYSALSAQDMDNVYLEVAAALGALEKDRGAVPEDLLEMAMPSYIQDFYYKRACNSGVNGQNDFAIVMLSSEALSENAKANLEDVVTVFETALEDWQGPFPAEVMDDEPEGWRDDSFYDDRDPNDGYDGWLGGGDYPQPFK